MELIISSLFLFIFFLFLSLVLSGKAQQVAKEVLKEIINGPEGKMLVGFFGSALVTGILFLVYYLLNE
ncbi:hypothetical protein DN401_23160 [Bacillus sp. BF2-3]|uniref:hypothetical protein n=1 Tax=Bacillus sp. BF2-3 TaxID=2217827 RepID=UPI0011EF3F17|nr:hypothetical protein [Bacillus sp. BF2-3]KAA0751526.1 hypothetical protein DN401_23160 [Bacillus sp. BF2-3]